MDNINEEIKEEIDYWLSKLILVFAEIDYKVDCNGNIIFRDKKAVMDTMSKTIYSFAEEHGLSMETVKIYLENIYIKKMRDEYNKPYKEEYKQVINILWDIEEH